MQCAHCLCSWIGFQWACMAAASAHSGMRARLLTQCSNAYSASTRKRRCLGRYSSGSALFHGPVRKPRRMHAPMLRLHPRQSLRCPRQCRRFPRNRRRSVAGTTRSIGLATRCRQPPSSQISNSVSLAMRGLSSLPMPPSRVSLVPRVRTHPPGMVVDATRFCSSPCSSSMQRQT